MRSLKLTQKLTAAFVAIGLLPFAFLGYLALARADAALEQQAFAQLESVRGLKKGHIEQFFAERRGDIEVLAGMVAKLDAAALGPQVEAAHGAFLADYVKQYGYYDLFLIDPAGLAFYTAAKEPDYNSNLLTGPYKDSNLGQLVRRVVADKRFGMADFAPYAPSKGEPAAFIALPLLDGGGQVKLVVALQLSLEAVNAVMQRREGMGKTGES